MWGNKARRFESLIKIDYIINKSSNDTIFKLRRIINVNWWVKTKIKIIKPHRNYEKLK